MVVRSVNYNPKYKAQCIELMTDTWDFNRLVPGLKKKNLMNELYFETSIIHENHSRVIVDEEENVYGFIFGHIPQKRISLGSEIKGVALLGMKCFYHTLRGSFGAMNKLVPVFKEAFQTNKELHEKKKRTDGYVNLFFISSTLRGQGWGKRLLNTFSEECKQSGTPRIYLYTDLGCNYKFYEHLGFSRTVELHSPVYDHPEEKVNAFAYVLALSPKKVG